MARRKDAARAWVRVSHRTKDKPSRDRRWEVVYEDPNQGFKRRTKGGFLTKRGAEAWRDDEFLQQVRKGGWVDPARGDALFKTVAEDWLKTYASVSGKARGLSQHEQIVKGERSLLMTEFGQARIGDISHSSVGVWLRKVGERRSASTVRHNFYTMRMVMRYALAQGLIQRDPIGEVKPPSPRNMHEHEAERYALTMREASALAEALPAPWDMYVRLAAATGMRPEELGGLQLRDVSEACDEVKINRVLVKLDKSLGYEERAKTPKSHRTIELDSTTARLLGDYIRDHQRRAMRWFNDHLDEANPGKLLPLFVGVDGFQPGRRQRQTGTDLDWLDFSRPVNHRWFHMRHWDAARKAAGLPGNVRFYDLRHAHISWHVERLGQPGALTITEISARAGHASTAMTLDRYSHSPRDRSDHTKKALDSMWATAERDVVRRFPKEA